MMLPEQLEANLLEAKTIAQELHKELKAYIEASPIFDGDTAKAQTLGGLMRRLYLLLGVPTSSEMAEKNTNDATHSS